MNGPRGVGNEHNGCVSRGGHRLSRGGHRGIITVMTRMGWNKLPNLIRTLD